MSAKEEFIEIYRENITSIVSIRGSKGDGMSWAPAW